MTIRDKPMKNKKEPRLLEIYAGTAVQAGLLKSLLENAEIDAYMKDEFTGVLYPWHSSPGGAGAVKLFVSDRDEERALIVVKSFEDNLKA